MWNLTSISTSSKLSLSPLKLINRSLDLNIVKYSNYEHIDVMLQMISHSSLLINCLHNTNENKRLRAYLSQERYQSLIDILNGDRDKNGTKRRAVFGTKATDASITKLSYKNNLIILDIFKTFLKDFGLSDIFKFTFLSSVGYCANYGCEKEHITDYLNTTSKLLEIDDKVPHIDDTMNNKENFILARLFNHESDDVEPEILARVQKLPELLLVVSADNKTTVRSDEFIVDLNRKKHHYELTSYVVREKDGRLAVNTISYTDNYTRIYNHILDGEPISGTKDGAYIFGFYKKKTN